MVDRNHNNGLFCHCCHSSAFPVHRHVPQVTHIICVEDVEDVEDGIDPTFHLENPLKIPNRSMKKVNH